MFNGGGGDGVHVSMCFSCFVFSVDVNDFDDSKFLRA